MTNEFEVLRSVDEENNITQRELAKRTGLSLGSVNVLLKRLIHKGLLKMEHVNSKTIKYMLTPQGLMEKLNLTYQYIVISYNRISKIESKIEQIAEGIMGQKVILLGETDELYEIISSKLKGMNVSFSHANDSSSLKRYNDNECIVITWSPEHIDKGTFLNTKIINILNI